MNYYERHIGDYLKDTAHLSLLEHGVYTRLLDVYYIREESIPTSEAARLVGARSKEERAALDVVLAEFFRLDSGAFVQDRCDREISRFQDKQRKAKASADARWSQTERKPNAMRMHSEGSADGIPRAPVPSLQSPVPIEEISLLSQAPARTPSERPPLALVSEVFEPKGPPDCPHGDVLALWAEVLPSMPQHLASQWRGKRADHLRARWRETAVEKDWTDKAQGLAYMRKFFSFVGQSAFLTGRTPSRSDRRPFTIELEWLVNPTNWAKVHEGKYHGESAA